MHRNFFFIFLHRRGNLQVNLDSIGLLSREYVAVPNENRPFFFLVVSIRTWCASRDEHGPTDDRCEGEVGWNGRLR